MAKGISKRDYHRQDMDKLNRTALFIGGAVAAAIVLMMVVSFLT
ncbi:MAG: hypothetical protein P4N41_16920 [Negativicutes bacterium]|nr:hypothetical protein [Negativicutes bacterium]